MRAKVDAALKVDDNTLALVRAQCLVALMSSPSVRDWVEDESTKPGKGTQIKIWSDLAAEYADDLVAMPAKRRTAS